MREGSRQAHDFVTHLLRGFASLAALREVKPLAGVYRRSSAVEEVLVSAVPRVNPQAFRARSRHFVAEKCFLATLTWAMKN
jgi:hypothetical protein